jgi:hypothetical protein
MRRLLHGTSLSASKDLLMPFFSKYAARRSLRRHVIKNGLHRHFWITVAGSSVPALIVCKFGYLWPKTMKVPYSR